MIGTNNFATDTLKFGYQIPFIFITISQLWRMHLLLSQLYLHVNYSVVELPFVPNVVDAAG